MYKLLLVDDEILVREAIAENMRWNELGYELVLACENGKEAISYIKENKIDVVITDICMPFIDGMELSKYIYENNKSIVNFIKEARHYNILKDLNLQDDLEYCCKKDILDIVPVVNKNTGVISLINK